ncbi:uncharacterized protein LOC118746982 [Rhagoletis pomonella]|uniref:uncharacterized protein LOC118746982 n=1 Tax=Rhagoletis pomonella TaxID=28610 RepID=UPI0017868B54|nr:uncharacterized protein LOC118746982 [Rhagoletis pomonella]
MVDAEYKFTYVDVGAYGRDSDGEVFSRCSLSKALETNLINIPQPQSLSEESQPATFVVVADDAFPLKNFIMKPYSFRQHSIDQRVFNYRLSRARRVVENAFGISATRFRVLRRCLDVSVDRAIKLVLAICVLHNFLLSKNNVSTLEVDHEVDGTVVEGTWRAILREENNFHNISTCH